MNCREKLCFSSASRALYLPLPIETPVIAPIDLGVQGVPLRRREGQRVLVEQNVARHASLVSEACTQSCDLDRIVRRTSNGAPSWWASCWGRFRLRRAIFHSQTHLGSPKR